MFYCMAVLQLYRYNSENIAPCQSENIRISTICDKCNQYKDKKESVVEGFSSSPTYVVEPFFFSEEWLFDLITY